MSDEKRMPIAEVIKRFKGAKMHIDRHGSAETEADKGLTLGLALALTALPDDLAKKLATELARPKEFLEMVDGIASAVWHYANEGGFRDDPRDLDALIANLKKMAQ